MLMYATLRSQTTMYPKRRLQKGDHKAGWSRIMLKDMSDQNDICPSYIIGVISVLLISIRILI